MIEKGKISSLQLAILFYPTIIASALLSAPNATTRHAKNDLWLSPVWAALVAAAAVLIVCKLHHYFPRQTVIQYSEKILGKFLGKVFGSLLIFNLFFTNGYTTRQYADLTIGVFLQLTPIYFVSGALMLVCAFAVRGGLEVVARSAQIFFPMYVLSIFLIVLLLVPDFNVEHLFPMFEGGVMPSIKGAAVPESMTALYFYIAYLLPFVKDAEKAMKWSFLSISAVTLTLIVINLAILFLFGSEMIGDFLYPVLNAARYISVAEVFEHIESLVVAVWVTGIFIKLSVQYYVTVIGLAQLFGLSDYKVLVFPVGVLNVLFAFWGLPNFSVVSKMFGNIVPFYAFFSHIALPCLLLAVAIGRKKLAKAS